MNYAIILAGGIGSRFWPLSRQSQPKQFLNVCSDKPMIEEFIQRFCCLTKKENIYIATNKIHNREIKKYAKRFNISLNNVLFEPEGKNTLAPIAFLSRKIDDIDSDAVIVVSPCDHFIKYNDRFLKALNKGIDIARKGYIVTLGIPPTRPEAGYGYIKIKSKIKNQKSKIYEVDRFIEKPDISRARKFIKDKRYYWNAGVFIFRPEVMLGEIKKFMPAVYRIIKKMGVKQGFYKLWLKLPSISIDYAIMERTKKAALLPADYGWMDLGSWQAIEDILKKDKDGNIFRGNCVDIGSRNSIVWSDNRLVATLGLDNIIVIDTKDALLVCSKDKAQDVKKIVQILKQKNFKKQI